MGPSKRLPIKAQELARVKEKESEARESSRESKSTTMSGGGGRKPAIPGGEDAEVEALLRAAQDAVLLKLQANSHLVSSTSASPPAAPLPLDGAEEAAIPGGEEAEVEALLRAAQDAVLLKLQANSHLVSSASASAPAAPPPLNGAEEASAALDPLGDDLAHRFDALKSRAAAAPEPKPKSARAAPSGMDELEARFAALKGAAGPEKEARVRLEDLGGESEEEDEADEVDKVMRWALDAARLDVATAGAGGGVAAKRAGAEEEEEKDEKSSVSSEEDDDEDERLQMEMARKRKEMAKSKSKNKWFFL